MTTHRLLPVLTACLATLLAGCTQGTADTSAPASPANDGPPAPAAAPIVDALVATHRPDVIYVPTPAPVVDAMLALAEVGEGDVLYDLGSGDGRIPIAAATKFGIRAVGIEIDPDLVATARANAHAAGVAGQVEFRQQDLFQADIGEATVVTLYLLQSLNVKLRPKLLSELRPGTRIVSHAFDMADEWPPEDTRHVDGQPIHRWTVPER